MSRFARCVVVLMLVLIARPATADAQSRDGQLRYLGTDTWTVSRTLDGVKPPEHSPVRQLFVDHLGPGTSEGLHPLVAFKDLRHLTVEVVSGVDLTPLAELGLESLSLQYVRDVDLAPLAAMSTLTSLYLFNLRDVAVPSSLSLTPSLQNLAVSNDGWKESGAPVATLIDAIDWHALTALRSLQLQVGGNEPLKPVHVDLGLLRGLPALTALRIEHGIRHRGQTASPLAKPFAGLPPRLRTIRIDAFRPSALSRALRKRYPRAAVSVALRVAHRPGTGSWHLSKVTGSPGWHTYGSLWEAFDGRYGSTESEALKAARRRLRRQAPALLPRLDFDQEADGTGISAPTRRDLIRALEILGIR